MHIYNIGWSCSQSSVDVREFLIGATDHGRSLQKAIAARVNARGSLGSLCLSTCERFELFLTSESANQSREIFDQLNDRVVGAVNESSATVRCGLDAARHLLAVSSGLESRIPGEPHVLGQVRKAYSYSLNEGLTSPVISSLARSAIKTGKRVRNETALNKRRTSLVDAAMQMVRTRQDLQACRVALLGTGVLASELAAQLSGSCLELTVVSKSAGRAQRLALRESSGYAHLADLDELLPRVDVLLAATDADSHLVTTDAIDRLSPGHPLLLVDLGVPRLIDPGLAYRHGIDLVDLEDLPVPAAHDRDVQAARQILNQELDRFHTWLRSRSVTSSIRELILQRGGTRSNRSRSGSLDVHNSIMKLKAGAAA